MLKTKLNQFLATLLLLLFGFAIFTFQAPSFVLSATSHIVISEIQIGGASATDEFVELYNPTTTPVDLTNWRLAKRTAGGQLENEVDIIAATMSGTIPAHGYFLIAHVNYDGSVLEDTTYAGPDSFSTNNTVLLCDNTGAFIDKVGLDEAVDNETTAFPSNPANNRSIERKAHASSDAISMSAGGADVTNGNGFDSDNNANDFVYRTLTQGADPQNTTASTETPVPDTSATPGPSTNPTPSPLASPVGTPDPSASPVASAPPSVNPSPTVTPSASPEPSSTPLVSPSATPVVSPSASPIVSPSASPSPSSTPSPTPNSDVVFQGMLMTCRMTRRTIVTRFFTINIPHISCSRNSL